MPLSYGGDSGANPDRATTSKNPYVIGIDPGISGAVAAVEEGGEMLWVEDMPTYTVSKASGATRTRIDLKGLAELVSGKRTLMGVGPRLVVIEEVGAMPGQGVTSMFSFGHAAGAIEGVVSTLGLAYELVLPQAWQRTQLEGRSARGKDASYMIASRLYPRAALRGPRGAILDGRADALLMARHGLGLNAAGVGGAPARLPLK